MNLHSEQGKQRAKRGKKQIRGPEVPVTASALVLSENEGHAVVDARIIYIYIFIYIYS